MSQPATPLTPARRRRQRDRRSLWAGLVVVLLHGGLLAGLLQVTQRPLPAAGVQPVPGPVLMTLRLLPMASVDDAQASQGKAPAPLQLTAARQPTAAIPQARPLAAAAVVERLSGQVVVPRQAAGLLAAAPTGPAPANHAPMTPVAMAPAVHSGPGTGAAMPASPKLAAPLAQASGPRLSAMADRAPAAEQEATALAAGSPSGRPASSQWVAARVLPGQALPVYPEAAREDGLQGTVHLQVHLDRGGQVLTVDWLRRSGVMLLDLAARDAVRDWRFEPARQGGEPVASALALSIRFQLTQPVSVTSLAAAAWP